MAGSECAVRVEVAEARQIVSRFGQMRIALNQTCLECCNDGWNVAPFNPNGLLALARHICLKPGIKLAAYQHRAGANGRSHVIAVPMERQIPSPQSFGPDPGNIHAKLPEWADDRIARHFQGDGTPESYFEASILMRELWELGAVWHGSSWAEYKVLLATADLPQSQLAWREPLPGDWRPSVDRNRRATTVTFWTYTGFERESVLRCQDQYGEDYDFARVAYVIADGPAGRLH